MITKRCLMCGKSFNILPYREKTALYCSRGCQHKSLVNSGGYWTGKKRSKDTALKISKKLKGNIPWNKGKIGVYSNDTLQKMSLANSGRAPWNKDKTGIYSEETLQKIRDARAKQTFPSKENHWHWKNKPAYSAIHKWLVREYGNPKACNICGLQGKHNVRKDGVKVWNIEWSNKTGQYIKDKKHYHGLCVKCHISYDKGS